MSMLLRKLLHYKPWRYFKPSQIGLVAVVCLSVTALVWPVYIAQGNVFDTFKSAVAQGVVFTKDAIILMISTVLYVMMIYLNGKLLAMASKVLMYVAQFNNFTDLPVIVEAWSTVRDLTNMFFIIILLVIAFGTLFRIEAYSWKKLLPKMILAAILVNYSRAICGFLVDASQVIMLTFVSAFKDALTVGLVEAFKLDELLDFGSKQVETDALGTTVSTSPTSRLLAIFMAGIMLGNLVTVMLVYIVLLAARLTMIWFLTVLSPLPYVANILPQTEKYSSQWWEMFGRYVTLGPLMMFFLWLSMFIAAKSVDYGGLGQVSAGAELVAIETANKSEFGKLAGVFDTRLLAGFVIADMMLLAGLKMAQDAASEFSEYTSKAADLGKFLTRTAPTKAGAALDEGRIDRLYEKTGLDLNVVRQYQKIQHKRADIKRKRETIGYGNAFSAAQKGSWLRSWLGAADFAYEQYTPVLGKQGLLASKHPFKSFLGRKPGNMLYSWNMNKRNALESGEKAQATQALNAKRRVLSDKYTTVAARDAALKKYDGQIANVNGLQTNGKGWNTADGSEGQAVLTGLKSTLEQALPKAKTEDEVRNIQAQLAAIDKALNVKGDVDLDMSASGLSTSLAAAKSDRLNNKDSGLLKQRKNWEDKFTRDDTGQVLATQQAVNDFITSKTDAEQGRLKAVNDKIASLSRDIEEYGPVVDYEGAQVQEQALAEERKKYAGEENEDVLRGLLKSKIHEKDGVGALAIVQHSAQVGHLNEMMSMMQNIDPANKKKYSVDAAGMKAMSEYIESNLGVNHEMVMAAMNDASKSAKHANHWAFAEAITQRDGKYEWRSDEERQGRLYGEASKVGVSQLGRSANRLGMGGYDADGNWKPEAPMMQLYVNAMPTMGDSAKKGFLNNNMGEHLFMKGNGKYEKAFREAIIKTHGSDPENVRRALEALEDWKRATHRKSGEYGTFQVAEDALNKAA